MALSSDKKVVILGSNGLLGSTLSEYLSQYYDVLPTAFSSSNENHLRIDITNKKEMDNLFKKFTPEYIINCAAYTDVDKAENNRELAYDINVNGIKNIISSSSLNCKIVHISTDYVFDGKKDSYTEEDIPNPLNYYGKIKLESENVLRGSNRNHIIFRTSVLFNNTHKCFYSWVLNELRENNKITVVDDQISNPTWTWSFSEAIYKSIINNLDGIYHYTGDDILSRFDFATKIAQLHDFNLNNIIKIKTDDLQQLAKRPLRTTLKTNKIKEMIDIEHPPVEVVLNTFINN